MIGVLLRRRLFFVLCSKYFFKTMFPKEMFKIYSNIEAEMDNQISTEANMMTVAAERPQQ